MSKVLHFLRDWLESWQLSLFEKVILVNSVMLVGEALAGLWVTSHNLETHHYLIDTGFIVVATLLTLLFNLLLMRASFRPLFHLLATIREVSSGKTQARVVVTASSAEIGELGRAFNSMLDRLETARREQTMLIFQAQEEERRRIALELHDEAGQNLTALLIHAELLSQSFQRLPATAVAEDASRQLTAELQQLTKLTQLTLDNIRILAQQLRPSVLDDLGLLAAFRWLKEDSEQRLHLRVMLHTEGMLQGLPAIYETALFRIAQESLTNVARHAHAQQVHIQLRQEPHTLCLQIQDDGCGYHAGHAGSGILGMRERATQLGGTLTIHSQDRGTIVQAVLPLPATIAGEKTFKALSSRRG